MEFKENGKYLGIDEKRDFIHKFLIEQKTLKFSFDIFIKNKIQDLKINENYSIIYEKKINGSYENNVITEIEKCEENNSEIKENNNQIQENIILHNNNNNYLSEYEITQRNIIKQNQTMPAVEIIKFFYKISQGNCPDLENLVDEVIKIRKKLVKDFERNLKNEK